MITTEQILEITTKQYEGDVFNVEVQSNERSNEKDDLYFIEADSMMVIHNCFPKDVNALLSIAKSLGVNMNTLEGSWKTNLEVRPERDWEKMKGRAVSL